MVLTVVIGGFAALSAANTPSGSNGVSNSGSNSGVQTVTWPAIQAEILAGYEGVVLQATYRPDDDFLVVKVNDITTEFGATRIACEWVKPILASHGVGGVLFAIYTPAGNVLATGSRC